MIARVTAAAALLLTGACVATEPTVPLAPAPTVTARAETQPVGTVNEDAAGKGWFVKLKLSNKAELDALMDQVAYDAYLKTL